jgi:hypothetical protein
VIIVTNVGTVASVLVHSRIVVDIIYQLFAPIAKDAKCVVIVLFLVYKCM